MKPLLTLILVATLCATSHGQTIKAVGYNTTNGQVVANTGTNVLTFTNSVRVSDDQGDSTSYTFYGMQGWGASISMEERSMRVGEIVAFTWGELENLSLVPLGFSDPSIASTTRANLGFSTNLTALWTATNSAQVRSNAGLPLAALTNTSNVTMMRALTGSTNTNEPHSGAIELSDGTTSYELTFSNGVLLKIISGL